MPQKETGTSDRIERWSAPCTFVWTDEQISLAAAHASAEFPTLLDALIQTGASPGEIAVVQKKRLQGDCWVLPPSDWKNGRKTGEPREIPLTDELFR